MSPSGSTVTVSLIPQRADLAFYAGDGADVRISATDAVTGDPLDLTGDITAQVKTQRSDTTSVIDFAVDTIEAGIGVLGLTLTGAQTAGLITTANMKFKGVWDVQWIAAGKQPRTLAQGNVTCEPDVTRSL